MDSISEISRICHRECLHALLARRPDLMQQYHLLAAQNEYIGVAMANRLPNISLNGLFGVGSSDISMLFTC